jgi:hypothetical protein
MHNQAMVDVVLPLVMNMSKGGEMGEKMQAKVGWNEAARVAGQMGG